MGNLFPEEFIEDVKASSDISNVISNYISIKASGANYKALCPFHREKTPSFMINPQKQIYKCFGCGEGGNVINFVMKIENIDFIEAVKLLAQRANIPLPEMNISEKDKQLLQQRLELYDINREAARFFYLNLKKKGNNAKEYLKERGISQEVMKSFGLGYAPHSWDDLLKYLKKAGYKEDRILLSGLIVPKKEKKEYYDRFRNRIIFPIFDARGNVIAFGGRVMDNSLPKYLNSPETPVFNKSDTLYALNIARKNITDNRMILVEGYMDVIALHQYGFKNCVATLGTSLTKGHAIKLKKYCNEVIICFDGDEAGEKATLRSLEIFKEVDLNSRVLIIPDELDPDDYLRENGSKVFKEQIDSAISLIDYKIILAKRKHNLTEAEGKIKFIKELAKIMRDISSPVEREVYINKIQKETGINEDTIFLEIYGRQRKKGLDNNQKYSYINKRDNKYIEAITPVEGKGHIVAEKQLLKAMLTQDNIIPFFKNKLNPEDFSIGKHQILANYLINNDQAPDRVTLENQFPDMEADIKEIYNTDIEHIDIEKALAKYISNLKKFKLLYQIKQLHQQQDQLTRENKLNKEEVEKELLKIGVEIMRLNSEIQKLQL
ncbi:DNA primase [Alkaliphilus serpentinus]|uniref:DNA primase n=1 Tax=Alkaliphilus serpentinus TaxID=1482731 RepID=A0A833HRM2_9FIRM|nr:DNA primase [Alkaliphilus serpentinus]KAB3533236.1 DNA primase [Alkaliphilus serpentinus]